jgi:hypothetical protein
LKVPIKTLLTGSKALGFYSDVLLSSH